MTELTSHGRQVTVAATLQAMPDEAIRALVNRAPVLGRGKLAAGGARAAASVTMVESQLSGQIAEMNRHGLFHFDSHFANVLTDGDRIYFADFGLATSPSFDLDAVEGQFLEANSTYDLCNVLTRLVNQVVTSLCRVSSRSERNSLVRGVAAGGPTPPWLDPAPGAVIARYAAVAAVINQFHERIYGHDRRTQYPATEAAAALALAGLA